MAVKLLGPIRFVFRLVLWVLAPPVVVLWHIIMLPVDLVLLIFDAFWVNARKTGWFGVDCRGRDSYAGGVCPPARKYTNKLLFRLVCPEMGRNRSGAGAVCRGGEQPSVRLVRGTVVIVAVALVGLVAALCVHRAWPGWVSGPGREEIVRHILAERIKQGGLAFDEGRYADALSLYRSALRLGPVGKELFYKIGLCYDELAEADSAVRFFSAAAEGDDAHPPAARQMALHLYARGDVKAAGDYARRALGLGVDDALVHAVLGDACLWDKDPKAAAPHIAAALLANPESAVVRVAHAHSLAINGQPEQAVEILDAVRDDPSVALLAGLYKLDLLRETGRADEALVHVESLARRFPDLPRLSMLLVDADFASGRRAEAVREAQRLKEQFRDRPDVKLEIAATLSRHGDDSLALQIAQECAADPGLKAPANVLMGEVFLRRGMPEHALAYAEQALVAQPQFPPALLLAGQAALTAGDKDMAGLYLNEAVGTTPESCTVWHALGMLHLAVGDLEAAEESLRKACELDPNNGQLRQDYGMVLFNAGSRDASKWEQAKTELLKAADLLERPMTAYTSLGILAKQSQDGAAARRYYLQAIQADPGQAAVAANNLAMLVLADKETPGSATVALALAYSAYVHAIGSQFEQQLADTLRKALQAAGVPADALGVAVSLEQAKPPEASATQASASSNAPSTDQGLQPPTATKAEAGATD